MIWFDCDFLVKIVICFNCFIVLGFWVIIRVFIFDFNLFIVMESKIFLGIFLMEVVLINLDKKLIIGFVLFCFICNIDKFKKKF